MRTLAGLVLVVGVVVAPGPAQSSAATVEGQIRDFEILPPELAVTAGDSITWANDGQRPHTVTDRGGLFDTDAVLPGQAATVTVDVPGTYEIFCQINPSRMNARLVVAPGPEPPTEVRVQAVDEAREEETKRFDPAQLEVAAGTRLILANVGGLRHSLVAEDGSFALPVVEPGAENGRFAGGNAGAVVDEPGTHAFFCEIHPAAMRGALVVTAAQVTADERAPPALERPPPAAATISVVEFAFAPTGTLVAPGSTVTWDNDGTKPHTATLDDVDLDTGRIEPGQGATLIAPSQPGSYSYRCSIHDQMRAVLVVSPERAAPAPAPVAAQPDDGDAEGATAGTAFAWAVAGLLVATGAMGLVLGLRRVSAG
ncbi:MAG: cupredoxin domain-containing protein [Acidimicrobiia bacterium]